MLFLVHQTLCNLYKLASRLIIISSVKGRHRQLQMQNLRQNTKIYDCYLPSISNYHLKLVRRIRLGLNLLLHPQQSSSTIKVEDA